MQASYTHLQLYAVRHADRSIALQVTGLWWWPGHKARLLVEQCQAAGTQVALLRRPADGRLSIW